MTCVIAATRSSVLDAGSVVRGGCGLIFEAQKSDPKKLMGIQAKMWDAPGVFRRAVSHCVPLTAAGLAIL